MLAYILFCFHMNHRAQETPFLLTTTLHTFPSPVSAGKETALKIHCWRRTIWLHSTICTLQKDENALVSAPKLQKVY